MNKKDYKRYKKLRSEIAQLNVDLEDTYEEIKQLYIKRTSKGLRSVHIRLEYLLREINLRKTIEEEIVLPKHAKIDGGFQDVQDFIKDNDFEDEETTSILEEYCSMYLTDNYNHNIYGFTYHVKGKDIYLTNIRWNENQTLPHDIKMVAKGKEDMIDNALFSVVKDPFFKGCVLINDKETKYTQRCSWKMGIRLLENQYYM